MTTLILGLCALACPVGMGVMMWLGGRASRQERRDER